MQKLTLRQLEERAKAEKAHRKNADEIVRKVEKEKS